MANQNQSDIISIIQDISNHFSLSEITPMNDEDYNLLINGKPITLPEKDYGNNYLSFIFVVYKSKYYPLLFYKIKHLVKNTISISGLPIFSKPTLNLLSRIGIEEEEIHKSNDINSVVISLLGLIEKKELDIKLSNGLSFYSTVDLLTQDIFDYLSSYLYSSNESKIDSLIRNEQVHPELDLDFFNFSTEIKKYTNESKVSKVIFSNNNLSAYFINYLVSLVLQKSGVTLLVNSDGEKRQYIKEFKRIFGNTFAYDLHDVKDNILIGKNTNSKSDLTLKDFKTKKEYDNFKEIANKFFESIQQLEGIYKKNKLKDINFNVVNSDYNPISFELNSSSYSRKDFNSDNEFFNNIKELRSILDEPLTSHPFYGFNVKYSESAYNGIKQLIDIIIKCLVELKDILSTSSLTTLEKLKLHSFKDIEEINEIFQFLSQCQNIPIAYFDKDFSEEESQIAELKSLFHKLSASKLVIQNLATKDIFSLDLLTLINNCHSHNLITRFKAYRQIKNYTKLKKRRRVTPLVKVIEKYVFSQARVNELLPKYEALYGSKILTLSGLREIENMYININKFKEQNRMDKSFSTSNEIIKKLLTDKRFYKTFSSDLELALSKYNECKNHINRYIDYFLFDKRDFISTTIDNNIKFFTNKLNGKTYELTDYISYISLLDQASPTLFSAINKCIDNNVSLNNLSSFFFTCLMNLNYKESKKEISLFKGEMDNNKSFYLKNLANIEKYICLDRKDSISSNQDDLSLNDASSEDQMSNKLITVATIDDLVGFEDNTFSNLIVYDKTLYDNTLIIDFIRISKNVFFVEDEKKMNQFTRNCIIDELSPISLLKRQFDFSKLEKETIDELNNMLKTKHLKLITDEFLYITDERRNQKYVLIPSSSLVGPIVSRELNEAFNFIGAIDNTKIMYLDVIKFKFDKKEAFKEMLLPYYH